MEQKELKLLVEESNKIKILEEQLYLAHDEILSINSELLKERDARYTLFSENQKLHQKVNSLMKSDQFEYTGTCDPVILKIALEKSRDQLTFTQKQLRKMMEDYADTVPKNDYDLLEIKMQHVVKDMESTRREYTDLEDQHKRLQRELARVKEELSEIKDRCSELERAGTPRPHWEICGDFIGGGSKRWAQLTNGLSSRDTLMMILKELGPAAKTENLEYFDGLGCDPIIPSYLRWEGKIRNRRLTRRELSIIINDIWNGKIESGNTGVPMQDYISQYFQDRYQQPSVRAEWAYNVCSAAEQMLDDVQIKLFWGILSGQLSEDIYIGLRNEWFLLRDNVRRFAKDSENIQLDELVKVMKGTFPLKSEVEIRSLAESARRQLKMRSNNSVNVDKLFNLDDEGFDRTDLARELYKQRQIAQDKYIKEIVNELGGKNALTKMITVNEFKRAFAIVDPAIDYERMEKNIRWAFSDKSTDLKMIYPLPLKVLAAKLASGNIERAGPRDRRKTRTRKITYR